MKQFFLCIISAVILALAAVPAYAASPQWIPDGANIQWPPPSYDVPAVAYDVNWLQIVTDSFKISVRAIASKGFWLMMLFALIGAIPDIFHMFFIDPFEVRRGVRRRALNRRIKMEDIKQNHAEIVAEKVRDLELANEAQQLFRTLNSEKLLAQKVRQMEFNAEATEIYKRENADIISKRRLADMERNFFDRRQFKQENRVELMREKVFDLKEAASARDLHKLENRDSIIRRRLADMETADNLRKFYREAKHDELVAQKVRQMETTQEARKVFDERYYSEDEQIAKRIHQMEEAAKAKEAYREKHLDEIKEKWLRDMEESHALKNQFREAHYNEDEEISQRILRMELNDKARDAYWEQNAESINERRLRDMEEHLKNKNELHRRNFETEVDERINQRLISHAAEMEYNDLYPGNYMERKDQYRKLAKEYYESTKYTR